MKFYNRKKELALLSNMRKQSKESACFTMMIGRRRIGKTALLIESVRDTRFIYIFITRKSEALLCAQYQTAIEEALGIRIFGEIREFAKLFELLMQHAQKENFTLIIDEFQELMYVNPSIISEIQRIWDSYHTTAKINFIVCGSVYSMMKKIFEDRKEPLYGRLTCKIMLQPFTTSVLKEILNDYAPGYSPEDLLCLYLLTEGVAKYVTLLMEAKAFTKSKMLRYTLSEGSPLLTEGKDMLISEFGKDYTTYFSILSLIAEGKTTQKEIDSIIGKNTGSYLVNLEEEYSLIQKLKPMFAKPNSRIIRYLLQDNFLRFWFRFIFPNNALIELNKNEMLINYVNEQYNQYSGFILEKYFREQTAECEDVTDVGNYWDKSGENEIDLIALNRFNKTALIGEVKRNKKKISIEILKKKSEALHKELLNYQLSFKAYSLEDM
ncbi:ATP-binding protein [Bacteroides sp.]